MSSDLTSVVDLLLTISPALIFLYATYWSFVIRRALVVHIYRNHALALALISAAFVYLFLGAVPIVGPVLNAFPVNSFYLIFVGLFLFVDSTIPVARRSDPLLRPFLNWERTRKVLWVLLLVAVAGWILFDNGGFPLWAIYVVLLPIVVGVPAFFVGSRRSGDPVFRRSLRWVGLAVLFFGGGFCYFLVYPFIFGFANDFSGPATFPSWVFFIVAAYSFYRSARSLAPTSRLDAFSSEIVPTTALSIEHSLGGRFLMGNLDSHAR